MHKEIFNRGIALLDFMQDRWDIILDDNLFKARLLHVAGIINVPCVDKNAEKIA